MAKPTHGCRAPCLEEGQLSQPSKPAVTNSRQNLLLGSCLSPAALGGLEGTGLALAPNPAGLAVSPLLPQTPSYSLALPPIPTPLLPVPQRLFLHPPARAAVHCSSHEETFILCQSAPAINATCLFNMNLF